MRMFGYNIIAKKVPAGGVAAESLTDAADRQSGRLEPGMVGSASPAFGPRPNPGPLPAPGETSTLENLRHLPIRWNFPYAFNQIWTPRRNALTPFAVLRQLAEVDDVIRICIETRKDQICSLGWDIVPRDNKQGAGLTSKINDARTFFSRPDKRRDFGTWLRMAIEDVLVVDALSIYRRKTRGGGLYALELKDGSTFLPLLAEDGDTPLPPDIAYRQIIKGVPMDGGDCTIDQLLYRPRTVRTFTPYGLSSTEAVLLTVNAALNRQVFNLQYYTEGNVPEGLLEAPEGFNPSQLLEFQDYIDEYLTGDLARRRRLKVVAHGTVPHQFKDPDFQTVYDEWLLKVRCAAFAVPPQEIGFTGDVNKATGQMQENVVYRRGVKPLSMFFKAIFDEILAIDLALPELEWGWSGGEPEDKLVQAQTDQIYVGMGAKSVDEIRSEQGKEPIGLGPYIETPMGPVFVEELLTRDPDDDPNTSEVRSPEPSTAPGTDDRKTPNDAGGAPEAGEKVSELALSDLRKWRVLAIKAVKAKKPVRDFVSEAIPFDLHARVQHFVRLAAESGEVSRVVAAFDLALADYRVTKAGEERQLTKLEERAAKAYKRVMQKHFRAEGEALLGHLKKGLES